MKPTNIIMNGNGYLALTDFGLAHYQDHETEWRFGGTSTYMAPEALRALAVEPACTAVDWWACGIILYEMIARRHVSRHPPDMLVLDIDVLSIGSLSDLRETLTT